MKNVFTVKEPFGEPTHGVVTEVDMFEGNVARGEDLGRQQLPAHMLLTELLKIGKKQSRKFKFVNCQKVTWM